MWILSLLPNYLIEVFVHGIVISAIVLYIISFFTGPYGLVASKLAIILGLIGLYFEGGYSVEKEWRNRVALLETKVKIAEAKSSEVNTIIETKVVEKIKVIKEKTDANIQYVDRVVTKYDNICTLSNAAIVLHDSASQNAVPKSTGAVIDGASDVKVSSLLTTVTENYGTCYQMRDQVLGWQEWYNAQKKIYDK